MPRKKVEPVVVQDMSVAQEPKMVTEDKGLKVDEVVLNPTEIQNPSVPKIGTAPLKEREPS